MTRSVTANIAASVQNRLSRLARERGEDVQLVLLRYANERLMFRLACSKYASQFVLKGAALFTLWTGKPHRATRDLDLLGFGDPGERHIHEVFLEILALGVEEDGVQFDLDSLSVGPIREQQDYGGVRVELVARLIDGAGSPAGGRGFRRCDHPRGDHGGVPSATRLSCPSVARLSA